MGNTYGKNIFDFYEIAQIHSNDPFLEPYNGVDVIIIGMSQDEEDGSWYYVADTKLVENGLDVPESMLVKTGRFSSKKELYDDSYITVNKGGDIISGNIVEDEK